MQRIAGTLFVLLGLCRIEPAQADAPTFDRPGIAFSTGTLPARSVAWEQGLPDFAHTSDGGISSTLYAFDSTLRVGLTDSVEAQIATSLNEIKTRAEGNTERSDGRGDVSFAIKAALPSSHPDFSWATLAAVTDANGARAFTNGSTTYDLGVAFGYALDDRLSAELYLNAEHSDGSNDFDVSPNLNFPISSTIAAFVEAAASYSGHGLDQALAGGGFTMMVTSAVQLDLSADFGLTSRSPDVLAGFGISVFFE
jgi:hypothetical protein